MTPGFQTGAPPAPLDDFRPAPLAGPLGLAQLFCRASSDPILARTPRKRWRWLIPAALALFTAPIYWGILQVNQSPRQAEEALAIFLIPAALMSEGLFLAMGAVVGELASRRLKLQKRLPELVLTPLRPLAIAQLALAPGLRFLTALIAALALLPGLFIVNTHPSLLGFMPVFAVIAMNAWLAAHAGAWAGFAISLPHDNPLRTMWAMGDLAMLMAGPLIFATIFGVGLGVGYNSAVSYQGSTQYSVQGIAALIALWLAPLAYSMKLLVMRAYAARVETAVIPRMEH